MKSAILYMNKKFSRSFIILALFAVVSSLALAATLALLLPGSAHAEDLNEQTDYAIWRDFPALNKPAPLPASLNGRNVVLRWNGKHNSDLFLARLATHVGKACPAAVIVSTHSINQALSRVPESIKEARANVKAVLDLKPAVVIAATADCRICAGWLAVEQVLLEERGVPTITLITKPFNKTFQAVRQNLRMAEMLCVVMPHPVANIAAKKVHDKADAIAPTILKLLGIR